VARTRTCADRRYGSETRGETAPIASLWGGNVQRAVLARELAGNIGGLIAAEPGTSIVPELARLPNEIAIDKPGKGMFCATRRHERLQALGISHLVFTGVTTDVRTDLDARSQ